MLHSPLMLWLLVLQAALGSCRGSKNEVAPSDCWQLWSSQVHSPLWPFWVVHSNLVTHLVPRSSYLMPWGRLYKAIDEHWVWLMLVFLLMLHYHIRFWDLC